MKKYSIVIPNYRMANTIGKTIESILDQKDYTEREIIVVLDGRDDEAEKIVKMYPDIKLLSTGEVNKGAPAARNMGAKEATGDYLLFLDADMILYPGALSTWADTFEEHPDCDFVYAGYKIEKMSAYPSEPFDPYFLRINNYIDGNFPMKIEIFPGWDESIKSLQDWDMWLTIVENGHKGFFIPKKYFFEKEFPKEGSITHGTSLHYHERRNAVMAKHNIKQCKICLTSFAAVHHAKRVAKFLCYDYQDWDMLRLVTYPYKAIYLIGNFPENANNNVLPFIDFSKKEPEMRRDIKKIIHWIGSDVLSLRTSNCSFTAMQEYIEGLNKTFVQYCQSKDNEKELKEMGLDVKALPLPIELERKDFTLPKDFTVAIYDHGTNGIYMASIMEDVIMAMPDINFIYYGAESDPINWWGGNNHQNLKFLGRLPIDDVIKQTSVLLRITAHDGYPVSPIEFMCAGRACITNQNVPYTFNVGEPAIQPKYIARLRKDIILKIRELKRDYPKKQYFDEAIDHFKNVFDSEHFKNEIEKGIK